MIFGGFGVLTTFRPIKAMNLRPIAIAARIMREVVMPCEKLSVLSASHSGSQLRCKPVNSF